MTGAFNRTCILQTEPTNKKLFFIRNINKSEPYQAFLFIQSTTDSLTKRHLIKQEYANNYQTEAKHSFQIKALHNQFKPT